MTKTPSLRVSTIVPTFRRPRELAEAITSVLAQEVPLEVWVVDDSPERSARAVVERAGDPRVHYLAMPEPSGDRPGLVRNLGLSRARGSYVHFLDDDDIAPRGLYRHAVTTLDALPEAGALFGRAAPFGLDERDLAHACDTSDAAARTARRCRSLKTSNAFAALQSFADPLLTCSAGLIRRSCAVALGGFDPALRAVEDVDLFARLFQHYSVHFSDEITAHTRARTGPRPDRSDAVRESYAHMHRRYRSELGPLRFFALKLLARTVLRPL